MMALRSALRVAVRAPVVSAVSGSTRASCRADGSPNRTPQVSPAIDAKASVSMFTLVSNVTGRPRTRSGGMARSALLPHQAIARPERRGREREDHVLGQHQRRNPHGRRAERQPHTRIAMAGCRARQGQVRRVAADAEQQEQQHALQRDERSDKEPLRAADRLPERKQLGAHAGVRVRIRSRQRRHRAFEIFTSGRWRHAPADPGHRRIAADRAIVQLARTRQDDRRERRRKEEIEGEARHRPLEPGRRHADDRQFGAVDADHPARRIAIEVLSPVPDRR